MPPSSPRFLSTPRAWALGLLGRCVLAVFMLSVGVAMASPLVHPQAMELVCSADGVLKVVVSNDDGVREAGAQHLDCALCLPVSAPPPTAVLPLPQAQPLGRVLQAIPAARLAAATAAPLPARGPPLL